MTITQLQYVLAVAEHKNFTSAAEKCFVTQPTLSMQIQKLEEELDVKIFDRNKKPIELTDVGKKVVEQAKKIVIESDRIKDIIEQEKGYIGGEFRLGILPTIMPSLLPLFLNNFVKKYPKVHLIVEEHTTEEILYRLEKGLLDAAIVATPLQQDNVKEIVLYYEPFVGYFPPDYKRDKKEITVEDIDINEILLLQDGHCFSNGIMNLCNARATQLQNKTELKSGSFETLLQLADTGLGVTFLPYLHTLDLSKKRKNNLIEFSDPKPSREVSLIFPKDELKKQIIDALHGVISGVVRGVITFQDVKIISPK